MDQYIENILHKNEDILKLNENIIEQNYVMRQKNQHLEKLIEQKTGRPFYQQMVKTNNHKYLIDNSNPYTLIGKIK